MHRDPGKSLLIDPRRKGTWRRWMAHSLVVGVLGCLGCGIPQLRIPDSGPILPENFKEANNSEGISSDSAITDTTGVENSAQLRIEDFFNDPTLKGMIEQALNGNQELKILGENIQIANNEVQARRGAFLPFFNIGGGAGMSIPSRFTTDGAVESTLDILPGQPFPNPLPDFLVASSFSWQLDIWRQLRNARDAAIYRYFGTAEGRNYVVTRLVSEVADNYFKLMALDKKLENLDMTIALQEKSLAFSRANKDAARGTELPVQRFLGAVSGNQSEKLIIKQEIVEIENRINFLLGRYPQTIERNSDKFFDLNLPALKLGVPSDLLRNRPDIKQAERELEATGLDVKVARARFFPTFIISGNVGYDVFNPKYFFVPEAIFANVAGNLVAPLINKKAIQAEYKTANAKQLQALYTYQRVTLNAYIEVINRVSMVEFYRNSIELRKKQYEALVESVDIATKLFQNARAEYIDVLFAQQDMMSARMLLIETKKQQLSAVVNAFQALGGGNLLADQELDSPLLPHIQP